jgi:STE24 endopeptidase
LQALLGCLLLPPVVAGFTYILQNSSAYVGLYLWAFLLLISLCALTLYPTLIAPLFNKFTPLESGPLRDGIEQLAASLSFPLKKLFVVDGSTRSAHSNAYMVSERQGGVGGQVA